ncbi:hypothetical protein H7849_26200 [Alloacidobacterium dinghuense]|uniref:Uncharacterized protein n=1 Tax=Alloacidobacterium dinghuense TaxID=2763107 RepID=A0A7G8BIQ3_9BACT|nr:hypothetical protein [Alloacidobacterium dinghuense]QNI32423.1 hypothetical protein H7849_26200 [Alloacidobacterium dinghuense]
MSRELNKAFVEDPVGFASRMPVVPPGAQAGEGQTKTFSGGVSEQFKGVPGRLRIIAGDLTSKGGHAELSVAFNNLDERLNQGWMALYYLPWIEDHVVRTTLRPRSETTRDHIAKQHVLDQKLNGQNGYQADPNNPDIFFTAAVDGCMVIVDGSPSQPVVYHANRKNLETATDVGAPNDARVPQMIQDMGNLKQVRPKNIRGPALPDVRGAGATAAMYIPLARRQAMVGTTVIEPNVQKKSFTKAMGGIFGARRDNTWRFYYQRLLRFNSHLWEQDTDLDRGPDGKIRQVKLDTWAWGPPGTGYQKDADVTEFWPGGNGHVLV